MAEPKVGMLPDDDGSVNVAIGVVKGQVVIEYEHPRKRVVYDAANAKMVAEQMAKAAYEAHYGVKAGGQGGASAITDDMIQKCINRAVVVGKIPPKVASDIVHALLPMVM